MEPEMAGVGTGARGLEGALLIFGIFPFVLPPAAPALGKGRDATDYRERRQWLISSSGGLETQVIKSKCTTDVGNG